MDEDAKSSEKLLDWFDFQNSLSAVVLMFLLNQCISIHYILSNLCIQVKRKNTQNHTWVCNFIE